MNYVIHLFAKVKSTSVFSTSAYCGVKPQILVHLVIKGRGGCLQILFTSTFKNPLG